MRALLVLALFASSAHAQAPARQSDCLNAFASRYMRETEGNLSRTIYIAAQSDVVLSFDEADALFGREQTTPASADRFANQRVASLLARIERSPNVERLASNDRRAIAAGFNRASRQVGIIALETAGGARVIEFSRADRRNALDYANATLDACPAP